MKNTNIKVIVSFDNWVLLNLIDESTEAWSRLNLVRLKNMKTRQNFQFGWSILEQRMSINHDIAYLQKHHPEILSFVKEILLAWK